MWSFLQELHTKTASEDGGFEMAGLRTLLCVVLMSEEAIHLWPKCNIRKFWDYIYEFHDWRWMGFEESGGFSWRRI